jgi:hypothetical protein
LDIVWRTATDSVGELVQILVAVLAEDDNGE